jgi:hypothetical protein
VASRLVRGLPRPIPSITSFFRQAVEAETAGADLVGRIAAYLRRAEANPALRFEALGDAS